ncbi:MAG: transposase [Thermotogota bacterium]|nr:transposase [Thermotogota bacterium]
MYGEGNINQEKLDGFVNTFNMELNPENRWIRMSRLVSWKAFEEKYAKLFKNDGRRAKTAREALGALVVQQLLNLTDRETVEIIQENPYIQYFRCFSNILFQKKAFCV